VSEQPVGALASFTAENLVIVNAETVEKILLLGRGFLDELGKR
jgi:hypothetical protein